MKTFDEVTKALSMCGRHPDCKGCPYENISYPTEIGNTCKDIMHYDALYYMQDRSDECQEVNSPLTWDELKQMTGMPVWIEHLETETPHGEWTIVQTPAVFGDVYLVTRYRDRYVLLEKDLGKTWQAYRKERK